jgi:hypothetical protein
VVDVQSDAAQFTGQFGTIGIHTEYVDNRDELEFFDNTPNEVRGIFFPQEISISNPKNASSCLRPLSHRLLRPTFA